LILHSLINQFNRVNLTKNTMQTKKPP
ncbi:uncharacterized protein METZ01_LOCUS88289, partial [marine metagenome]